MRSKDDKPPFDPAVRAAEKAASRREDARALDAGEISRAELAKRNSLFGALDVREAKIVSPPRLNIKC